MTVRPRSRNSTLQEQSQEQSLSNKNGYRFIQIVNVLVTTANCLLCRGIEVFNHKLML